MFFVQKIINPFKISIRSRLTILFVIIFGSVLIFFSTITYQLLAQTLTKEFDDALFNYSIDISESISLRPEGDLELETPALDHLKIYPFSMGDAHIQIRNRGGQILEEAGDAEKIDLPYKNEFLKIQKGEEPLFHNYTHTNLHTGQKTKFRIISQSIDNNRMLLLQIAVPLDLLEEQISSRKRVFIIIIPTALIIATLAGYLLSRRAFQPIQEMILKAQQININEISYGASARLPIPNAEDEMKSLALTLNEMLTRIESAFRSQERFIADASHQLLTPLTIMKSEIESHLKKESFDPKVLLNSIHHEVDRLTLIVRDLLTLARVDAGKEALTLSPLHLDNIIADTISRLEKIAAQKQVHLSFHIHNKTEDPDFHPEVLGEADLLSNLISNLIENAIKYSNPNSHVQVELEWHRENQVLLVSDFGKGIDPEQITKIFERFYRVPGTRNPGHGLGLAIAKKIAEVHGGRLTVQSNTSTGETQFNFTIGNC